MAGNPFRCDCATSHRFETPYWLEKNRGRVLDAEGVECVENLTRALLLNDTTVLSSRPPNLGAEQFAMPMLQFLQEENR